MFFFAILLAIDHLQSTRIEKKKTEVVLNLSSATSYPNMFVILLFTGRNSKYLLYIHVKL